MEALREMKDRLPDTEFNQSRYDVIAGALLAGARAVEDVAAKDAEIERLRSFVGELASWYDPGFERPDYNKTTLHRLSKQAWQLLHPKPPKRRTELVPITECVGRRHACGELKITQVAIGTWGFRIEYGDHFASYWLPAGTTQVECLVEDGDGESC